MKGSDFVFDFADGLHYKYHKVSLNCGGACIEPPKWINDQKAVTNPQNINDASFQYMVTVLLNQKSIGKKFSKNNKG